MKKCNDRLRSIRIHSKLNEALEKVESFKHDSSGLLNALIPHSDKFREFEKALGQATIFWSLSSVLNEMRDHPEILNKFRPTPSLSPTSEEDKLVSYLLQAEAFTSASIVFRTWVSLVYIRADKILIKLREVQKCTRNDHLNAFIKLLNHDEVRHIRNAISHGTIDAFAMELNYSDKKYSECISYDQLDKLNYYLYTLLLSVYAASIAP